MLVHEFFLSDGKRAKFIAEGVFILAVQTDKSPWLARKLR